MNPKKCINHTQHQQSHIEMPSNHGISMYLTDLKNKTHIAHTTPSV